LAGEVKNSWIALLFRAGQGGPSKVNLPLFQIHASQHHLFPHFDTFIALYVFFSHLLLCNFFIEAVKESKKIDFATHLLNF
jgi:hypothetical protein